MKNISIPIQKGYPAYITINSQTRTAYLSYSASKFIFPINIEQRSMGMKIEANFPENIAVNSSTNTLYATSSEGIHVISGSTNLVTALIEKGQGRTHGSVSVNAYTNTIYATCFGSNILTVIHGGNHSVIESIEVGKRP